MDIQKIRDIFNNMTYAVDWEDTSSANQWLQTIEIVDKSSEVENILNTINPKEYVLTKGNFIRLCKGLEKNIDTIAQIEILTRGILSKDTKKAVEMLVEYFYYYASLIDGNSKKEVAVGIFDDDHPLWILGLFLGPALAAGHTIVLKAGTKFAAIITYVFKLAVEASVPSEALTLVPTNENNLEPYFNNTNVTIVSLFVDYLLEKCPAVRKFITKVLIPYKTSMLVFDNCDLDSAVENVIESAWGYQGMLPWSINTILIQENVFKSFTQKLKTKLESLRIGKGNDKLADIAYPQNPEVLQQLERTVDKARTLGIEVYQKDSVSNNFTPTLIIGSRVNTNNVLTAPLNDAAVTLLAFRSIDEAINLANNTRQGLGASVWSENVGLANEVARKLQVANVWINGHGLFSPHLPLAPVKDSGVGYFGGPQGLAEYNMTFRKEIDSADKSIPTLKTIETVKNAVTSGKNASTRWSKSSVPYRIKVFVELNDFIEENQKKLADKTSTKWLDNFKAHLGAVVLESAELSGSTQSGYNVTSLKYPRGVLLIASDRLTITSTLDGTTYSVFKLLLAALFEGNAVILLHMSPKMQEFYQELSNKLPAGILTVFPFNDETVESCLNHKEVNGYFSTYYSGCLKQLPLRDSKIFTLVPDKLEWKQAFSYVTVFKHVWSNIGQSSQCSL